jgi:RNA polymerase-associated protein
VANTPSRRSAMTLYDSPTCAYSHRVRFVLFEKGIAGGVDFVDSAKVSEDFREINPAGVIPTMVDRDLVLYDSRIIMEYLDERFPHPPLHPLDPVARARARMLMHRIDQDWFPLLDEIESSADNNRKKSKAVKELGDRLTGAAPLFAAKPYALSDEFSLVDCCLAPLLWRLPFMGIHLPAQADALKFYAARIFGRDGFQSSLSDHERGYATTTEFLVSAR